MPNSAISSVAYIPGKPLTSADIFGARNDILVLGAWLNNSIALVSTFLMTVTLLTLILGMFSVLGVAIRRGGDGSKIKTKYAFDDDIPLADELADEYIYYERSPGQSRTPY